MAWIEIDAERCKGCAICVEECPRDIIRLDGKTNKQGYIIAEYIGGREKCNACLMCADMCPDVCIEVFR